MDNYWANAWILDMNGSKLRSMPGKKLEAKDEKSAIEEAKAYIKAMNDQERKSKSDLRYALHQVVKSIQKMRLKDKSFWFDEQTFKDFYPNEKYPK